MPALRIPAVTRGPRPALSAGAGLLLLALLTGGPARAAAPLAPEWDHDPVLASAEGYAQLSWALPLDGEAADVDWVYHLQEGREPVFDDTDVQYMGPQHSSFVSGLDDGAYYYRVRARHPDSDEWGPWSEITRVDVQHHDRGLALGLMAIGGLVFLATATFLLRHRNDPIPSGAPGGGA